MATRFAVASGNWSSGGTWDNGSVPVSGDTVYPNGWAVTIDTDIDVASLNTNIPPVYLPNMSIPQMFGNNSANGNCIASSNQANAYIAFDYSNSTSWVSAVGGTGWVGYQFPNVKTIKRYRMFGNTGAPSWVPKDWIFEASNDGTNYVTLHSVTGNTGIYLSSVLDNATGFTYYRINVSNTIGGAGYAPTIFALEMTESTGTTYGSVTGGYFTVPSTLVGTRTINQTGAGIISNNASSGIVLYTNNTSGNTVNFNTVSGGYIINPSYMTADANTMAIQINGNGTINFNGDVWGCNVYGNRNANGSVNINAKSTVTVNGNVYTTKGSPGTNSYTIRLTASAGSTILNINGNIIASNQVATSYGISVGTTATINIIGNITSDISSCIIHDVGSLYLNIIGNISYTNASSAVPITTAGSSIINITGSIAAPPNAIGLNCGVGAATVNMPTGVVIAGTNAVGISAPSATLVTVFGPLINTNNTMAVYANRLRFYSGATTQWRFQDTANATRVLYQSGYTGTTIGLPASIDVRKNTVYGQYNELIGSLVVPSPSDVRINVLTDNTVGTGQLTADDFLNAITASTHPIAVRLKNISTTQTMGDQLATLSGRT